MGASVSVPLWLFLIIVLLAAWAVGVLLLAPGMRWFFRRRINTVIEELNTRLRIELPSFKLTRREVLIDRLFHDPRIQAAAEAHARESGEPLVDVRRRIDRYAREYRVLAAPSVIDLFLDEESQALAMLSDFIGKPISLQAESGYTQEQFDIVLM